MRPQIPTAWHARSIRGWRSSTPLARSASINVAPAGTMTRHSSAVPSAGLHATTTVSVPAASARAIDLLRTPHECIDERVGDAVEDRADQRFERAVRERIAQLEVDLAGLRLGLGRSEERRVGKECRSRWSAYQ